MQINDPKKLYLVFGICLIIGIYISIFVAFKQISINPYIVLVFGILIGYFGAKGIFKTYQHFKNKE